MLVFLPSEIFRLEINFITAILRHVFVEGPLKRSRDSQKYPVTVLPRPDLRSMLQTLST